MTACEKVEILYFTDILCVWAYLEQIRVDELKAQFNKKIELKYHFIPIFGSVSTKMENDWSEKGGLSAYGKFVHGLSAKYKHIEIHPDIWVKNTPTTSINCHAFLKAIQLLEVSGEIPDSVCISDKGKTVFETVVWRVRSSFFKDAVDISNLHNLMGIAEALKIPVGKIQSLLDSGVAHAKLSDDIQLKQKHEVKGSPTLVFNEGRQMIYGNVGYKVVAANIEELLKSSDQQANWC